MSRANVIMARNAAVLRIQYRFSPGIGSQLTAKKPQPKPGPNCLRSFSGFALVRPGAVRPDRLAVRPFRAPAVAGLASVGRRRPAVGPACPGRPVAGRGSVGSDFITRDDNHRNASWLLSPQCVAAPAYRIRGSFLTTADGRRLLNAV